MCNPLTAGDFMFLIAGVACIVGVVVFILWDG